MSMQPVSVDQADVIQALAEKVAALTLENAQLTAAIVGLQRAAEPESESAPGSE